MTKVTWRPSEPARDKLYRKLREQVQAQDESITFVLKLARGVQHYAERLEKRINLLEEQHADQK